MIHRPVSYTVASMAWNLHAIAQTQCRVDGVNLHVTCRTPKHEQGLLVLAVREEVAQRVSI